MDIRKYLIEISERIATLETKLESLEKHFTNHLHTHKLDRIINTLYFLAVVALFCYIKWGIKG